MIKFCLSSQQGEKYLQTVDEIKTPEALAVSGLLKKFPKARIIYVENWEEEKNDWAALGKLAEKFPGRLCVCLRNLESHTNCDKYNIKFYYGFRVCTFVEVRALVDLGVSYLVLGAPLTHQIEKVARFQVPIRLVPNLAAEDAMYIPYDYAGSWIRPEDTAIYDEYDVVFEFEDAGEVKERTLYDIYKNKKSYAGPMQDYITNFNHPSALNRLIPNDLVNERIKCGQRCMMDNRCHLCETYLGLADKDVLGAIIQG